MYFIWKIKFLLRCSLLVINSWFFHSLSFPLLLQQHHSTNDWIVTQEKNYLNFYWTRTPFLHFHWVVDVAPNIGRMWWIAVSVILSICSILISNRFVWAMKRDGTFNRSADAHIRYFLTNVLNANKNYDAFLNAKRMNAQATIYHGANAYYFTKNYDWIAIQIAGWAKPMRKNLWNVWTPFLWRGIFVICSSLIWFRSFYFVLNFISIFPSLYEIAF